MVYPGLRKIDYRRTIASDSQEASSQGENLGFAAIAGCIVALAITRMIAETISDEFKREVKLASARQEHLLGG